MPLLYIVLVAVHVIAIIVTGILWVIVDLNPQSKLKCQLPDIRAVHFGSLYLVPWFLALMYAFERFRVPWQHWLAFPVGLAVLVIFAGIGYLFPRPADLPPFYYWTRGWPLVLSLFGLAGLIIGLLWTATVLFVFAM